MAVLTSKTAPAHHARAGAGSLDWSVVRLMVRLVRRGVLLLALGLTFYTVIEAVSYLATYPDAESRASLAQFQDSPAVRMMQGYPHAVDTVGGFVAWDGGWFMQSIAAIWALLVAGRLLRGEEESERAEFVLTGPVSAGRVLLLQFLVIGTSLLLVGAAIATAATVSGASGGGSVVYGLGIAGFAGTFAGVAAVFSQLFLMRRRVTALTAVVLGVAYVLRMISNSDDALNWLHWFTPYGWMDELHAFRDPNWVALALLVLAPAALSVTASRLRLLRDTGGALLAGQDGRPPRDRFLGGSTAFAWRTTQGMLFGWTVGIGLYALITGSLIDAVIDYMDNDPNYREVMEAIGWDVERVVLSFVAMMGTMFGLFTALFACWRIGAARAEESSGRLDAVLTRPVSRAHWLGGHLALTLAGALAITVVSGLAMWAGSLLTGGDIPLSDVLGATLNSLPVIAFFIGVTVLVYAFSPRLTVGVPAAAAFVAYLVETIGPGLKWPSWILDLSPFHHLAQVPAEPFAPLPATILTVLAVALMALGLTVFHHRDLTGD